MPYGIGKTDIGKIRKVNEDSIFVSNNKLGELPNLYIVADGMGGHNAGDVASQKSIEYFCEYIERNKSEEDILDFLIDGFRYSNKKVYLESLNRKGCSGMGTTFSACVIKNGKLFMIHIGDSRIYLIRNNKMEQISIDHSYVNEMVRNGLLPSEKAQKHPNKNIITRALGIEEDVLADGNLKSLEDNDKILICSDGLTNMISDDKILEYINKHKNNIDIAIRELIEEANINGGEDNISVIIIGKGGSR